MALKLIDSYRAIITTGNAEASAADQAEADKARLRYPNFPEDFVSAAADAAKSAEADRYHNREIAKKICDEMEQVGAEHPATRRRDELARAWDETGYPELGVSFDARGKWHSYPLSNVLQEGPNRSRKPWSLDAKVGCFYLIAMLLFLLGFCLTGGK